MSNEHDVNTETRGDDDYEAPALTAYGSIEEWTKGAQAQAVILSIFL